MSEWSETVKIGIILVIIAAVINIVISTAVLMNNDSKDMNQKALNTLESDEIREFIKYDGAVITGAEAAVFIEKHYPSKKIGVIVNNGKSTKKYIRGVSISGNIAEFDENAAVSETGKISNKSESGCYIKPSDVYNSIIYRNKSEEIVCIFFEKC